MPLKPMNLDSFRPGRSATRVDDVSTSGRAARRDSNASQDTLLAGSAHSMYLSSPSNGSETTLGGLATPKASSIAEASAKYTVPFDVAALRELATSTAVTNTIKAAKELHGTYLHSTNFVSGTGPLQDGPNLARLNRSAHFDYALAMLKEIQNNKLSIPTDTFVLLMDICWRSTLRPLTQLSRHHGDEYQKILSKQTRSVASFANQQIWDTYRKLEDAANKEMIVAGLQPAFEYAAAQGDIQMFGSLEQIMNRATSGGIS